MKDKIFLWITKQYSKIAKGALVAIASVGISLGAAAQERRQPPESAPVVATQVAAVQNDNTAIIMADISSSFVDTVLQNGMLDRSEKRIKELLPRYVGVGSEVRVAMIGHSHSDITNTFDHLKAKSYKVSKNRYTPERAVSAAVGYLDEIRDGLKSGKIKKQQNTAVAMALDHSAEIVRLNGKNCVIFLISDMEDTEYKSIPEPATPGGLSGCKVYALAAGITLPQGSEAQRALKKQWEKYMQTAGVAAKDFFWIPNP